MNPFLISSTENATVLNPFALSSGIPFQEIRSQSSLVPASSSASSSASALDFVGDTLSTAHNFGDVNGMTLQIDETVNGSEVARSIPA